MEITIDKNNVYDFAAALTTRIASTSESYGQIAITKDNYPLLDVYLSEAVVSAEGVLRKKIADSHAVNLLLQEERIVLRLKENVNTDPAVMNLASSSIRLYLAYHVAAGWLLASPAASLAENYGATALAHLQTALNSIGQKRSFALAGNDYEERKNDSIRFRAVPHENCEDVLLVRDESGVPVPAVTNGGEILMSNT
jgi:hypothetical protein